MFGHWGTYERRQQGLWPAGWRQKTRLWKAVHTHAKHIFRMHGTTAMMAERVIIFFTFQINCVQYPKHDLVKKCVQPLVTQLPWQRLLPFSKDCFECYGPAPHARQTRVTVLLAKFCTSCKAFKDLLLSNNLNLCPLQKPHAHWVQHSPSAWSPQTANEVQQRVFSSVRVCAQCEHVRSLLVWKLGSCEP